MFWTSLPGVMLAIGRQQLPLFYSQPQHTYLLRLVTPQTRLEFPDHILDISRGPFTTEADNALLKRHQIEMIVAKIQAGPELMPKLKRPDIWACLW